MKILEQLENRVLSLLEGNKQLRVQYDTVVEEASRQLVVLQTLEENNRNLEQALADERQTKSEILHRIDTLLECLDDTGA